VESAKRALEFVFKISAEAIGQTNGRFELVSVRRFLDLKPRMIAKKRFLTGGTVIITTTRFGKVQIAQEDVINFPEGILGFNDLRRFVLLDDPNDEIFAWLQSCEVPDIAFPVLEPEIFAPEYKPMLTKTDNESLRLEGGQRPRAFAIITIPEDPTLMTANLKAPILVNVKLRLARQCVLQDNQLQIREAIFAKLQQRVVQNPSVSIKSQTNVSDLGVVVRPIGPEAAT
jgi:flagellar assembly factor FliW